MAVLSIQSWVSAGHVGNAAALLPLNRMGLEVWPVNTVAFSNHPAHGQHAGRIVPAPDVQALIEGIAALGLLPGCRAVLSGYLGEAATGAVVLDTVTRVKATRDDALYCCDPVMGDGGRVFVAPGIVDFFAARAVPAADILLPNAFEAGLLTGMTVTQPAAAREAARSLSARGAGIVVVTGVPDGEGLATVAVERAGNWVVRTPRLPVTAWGAGDLFTALFLGGRLGGRTMPAALSDAVSGAFAVIAASADAKDLALIAAQEAMLDPPCRFPAEPLP